MAGPYAFVESASKVFETDLVAAPVGKADAALLFPGIACAHACDVHNDLTWWAGPRVTTLCAWVAAELIVSGSKLEALIAATMRDDRLVNRGITDLPAKAGVRIGDPVVTGIACRTVPEAFIGLLRIGIRPLFDAEEMKDRVA